MTMTINLPREIVEKVLSKASCRGIKLEALLMEKIQAGLSTKKEISSYHPWMKYFGSLPGLHDERKGIASRMAEEFEQVNPEEWRMEDGDRCDVYKIQRVNVSHRNKCKIFDIEN